jgi:hypothetical protein
MNPAGDMTDEEEANIRKAVRKVKAQEFRGDTWVMIAQLVRNQNWLMKQLLRAQADAEEARHQVKDVVSFLREVAEGDVSETTNH